jgi:putative spermidine/putrescine transport system permease protein
MTAVRALAARFPAGHVFLWGMVAAAYLFVHAPTVVVLGASFGGATQYAAIEFPPTSLSLARYFAIPASQFEAIWLSVRLAALSATVAVALGVPAALGLVRGRLRFKIALGMMFRAPLQIPTVVVGITFLQLVYAVGDLLGADLTGSILGLVVAHSFVGTPYVIGAVTAVLQRFDRRLEEAALSLGASRWRTFRRVTLPLIAPGVYSGALYAFMVSFADVPIAIFLSAPGATTYPVEVFSGLQEDFDQSILASASLVIAFCFGAMLLVQRAVGLEGLLRAGGSNRR